MLLLVVVLGSIQEALEKTLRGDRLMKTWQAKDSVMKGAFTPKIAVTRLTHLSTAVSVLIVSTWGHPRYIPRFSRFG